MARDPREAARACFELARRGATDGERANGLSRGMALIERHGLDPNDFDIPGRERQQRRRVSGFDFGDFGGREWSGRFTVDVGEAMRAYFETMRQQREAQPQPPPDWMDEAIDAAFRRAQQPPGPDMTQAELERVARKVRRQQQLGRWPTVQGAVDYLFSRGVQIYDQGPAAQVEEGRWFDPRDGASMDDWGVRDLADKVMTE